MTLQARAQVGALAAEQRKLAIDSVKADRAKRGVEYEPKDASHDSHLGDGTAAKARKTSPKLKTSSSRERIDLVASQSRSKALSIFSRRSSGGGADVGSKVAAKGFGTSEVSTKRSVVARMPGGQLKARTPKDMSEGLSGAAVEMFEASASADDSVIDAVDELGQQAAAVDPRAGNFGFNAASQTVAKSLQFNHSLMLHSRIYSFYNTPIVKYFLRALSHLAWLGLYIYVIYDTNGKEQLNLTGPPPFQVADAFWIAFHVGSFLDQRHIDMKQQEHRYIATNSWRRLWVLVDLLFIAAFVCYVPSLALSDLETTINLYRWYQVLLSLNILIITILLLPYFCEWKDFGILVIQTMEMVVDVATWSLLLLVVMLGFSLCLLGFDRVGWYYDGDGNPFDGGPNGTLSAQNAFSSEGAFWAPFWVLYGDVVPVAYGSMTETMTGWLVWVYSLTGTVVLVNLLVAMFADTFQRVRDKAESEFYYQRYMRVFEYRHIQTMAPPPFNLVFCLYELVVVKLGLKQPFSETVNPQFDLTDGSHLLRQYETRKEDDEAKTTHSMVSQLSAKVVEVEKRMIDEQEKSSHKMAKLQSFAAEQTRVLEALSVQLEALSVQLEESNRRSPNASSAASAEDYAMIT